MQRSSASYTFSQLSVFRQVGILLGFSASIALGGYIILWAQKAEYAPLFVGLDPKDAADVVDGLARMGIPYRVSGQTGYITVPENQVQEAKMQLAQEGIPSSLQSGFTLMEKEGSFGESQFAEYRRHIKGIEIELSRTLTKIKNVKTARVHLAVKKESSFVRNKEPVSASVFVDLYAGHPLEKRQVAAIVNLVSASVPGLESHNVSVIDQNGNLLSQEQGNDEQGSAVHKQREYVRELESSLSDRIVHLLEPMIGPHSIRAHVTADIDFTRSEQTLENYDPDKVVVRSEQIKRETQGQGTAVEGGPIGVQSIEEISPPTADKKNNSQREQSSRSYEVNRSVTHIRNEMGRLKRLSVAVVVDDKSEYNASGKVNKRPLDPDELEQVRSLVQDAVGFQKDRGDSISVINKAFSQPPMLTPEPLPPEAWYEAPWVWPLAKVGIAALGLLTLIFGILRPVMRNLSQPMTSMRQSAASASQKLLEAPDPLTALPAPDARQVVAGQGNSKIDKVRSTLNEDPKKVAQVVMNWVGEDE